MRIVSLLASGTELICALGQGEALVGRSHECNDPAWVTALPSVSAPTFPVDGPSAEIDRLVREKLRAGEPLYELDRRLLIELRPDLVITQSHCDVCAVGPGVVSDAHTWPGLEGLRTVSMRGGSLAGVLDDFTRVAAAAGFADAGRTLVASLREQQARWRQATAALPRPTVLCLEWTDPPFPMGNWGPELVETAGGTPVLGTRTHIPGRCRGKTCAMPIPTFWRSPPADSVWGARLTTPPRCRPARGGPTCGRCARGASSSATAIVTSTVLVRRSSIRWESWRR